MLSQRSLTAVCSQLTNLFMSFGISPFLDTRFDVSPFHPDLDAVGGGERCLLLQQEQVQEDEYRQAVQAFETTYLPVGILDPPLVVTLEEWRRYSDEGPFAEELPGS